MAVVETPPFILVNPKFEIGPVGGPLKDLHCSLNQIDCGVDQDSNDYDTFCGSYRSYGVARYTITLTVYQNFDAGGPWEVLWPLRGTIADFQLLPDAGAASGIGNPLMFGQVRVPPLAFLSAAVNEASSIDIELAVQGEPSFAPPDTAPAGTEAAEASAPASGGSSALVGEPA